MTSYRWYRAALVSLLLATLPLACQAPPAPTPAPAEPGAPTPTPEGDGVERGEYLVKILACGDCHTPFVMGPAGPLPDDSRRLSGHPEALVMPPSPDTTGAWAWHGAATNTAFAGPWGVSYAINLTPDPSTGIGAWSEEIFIGALRSGRHVGQSRAILPPMPWQAYGQMTNDDLAAVYAYLRTVPSISNRVPDAHVALPPPATASGG